MIPGENKGTSQRRCFTCTGGTEACGTRSAQCWCRRSPFIVGRGLPQVSPQFAVLFSLGQEWHVMDTDQSTTIIYICISCLYLYFFPKMWYTSYHAYGSGWAIWIWISCYFSRSCSRTTLFSICMQLHGFNVCNDEVSIGLHRCAVWSGFDLVRSHVW